MSISDKVCFNVRHTTGIFVEIGPGEVAKERQAKAVPPGMGGRGSETPE
jgi:hypothetical protein